MCVVVDLRRKRLEVIKVPRFQGSKQETFLGFF